MAYDLLVAGLATFVLAPSIMFIAIYLFLVRQDRRDRIGWHLIFFTAAFALVVLDGIWFTDSVSRFALAGWAVGGYLIWERLFWLVRAQYVNYEWDDSDDRDRQDA